MNCVSDVNGTIFGFGNAVVSVHVGNDTLTASVDVAIPDRGDSTAKNIQTAPQTNFLAVVIGEIKTVGIRGTDKVVGCMNNRVCDGAKVGNSVAADGGAEDFDDRVCTHVGGGEPVERRTMVDEEDKKLIGI